jgi:hypothetical protein
VTCLTAAARGGALPARGRAAILPLARGHVQAVPGTVQDQLDLILVRTLNTQLFSMGPIELINSSKNHVAYSPGKEGTGSR